jgi:hypothetical protein
MVYYIISCFKEDADEQQIDGIIRQNVLKDGRLNLGELYSLTNGLNKDYFKVGSLD